MSTSDNSHRRCFMAARPRVRPAAAISGVAQLRETARKHFAGRDDLLLVTIDADRLDPQPIWEPSRGGDLFPHLYAPLPMTAVRCERDLSVTADGAMIFDDGATGWA